MWPPSQQDVAGASTFAQGVTAREEGQCHTANKYRMFQPCGSVTKRSQRMAFSVWILPQKASSPVNASVWNVSGRKCSRRCTDKETSNKAAVFALMAFFWPKKTHHKILLHKHSACRGDPLFYLEILNGAASHFKYSGLLRPWDCE